MSREWRFLPPRRIAPKFAVQPHSGSSFAGCNPCALVAAGPPGNAGGKGFPVLPNQVFSRLPPKQRRGLAASLLASALRQRGLAEQRPQNIFFVCYSFYLPFHYAAKYQPERLTRCELPALRITQEDPCTTSKPAIYSAINSLPAPYARAGCRAFPSYPCCFMPGQPGQPGQPLESLANRSFRVFNLHIYAGTQPGHAGTLRYQGVSGRAIRRVHGHAPLSCAIRFQGFCSRSQTRPSVPPWSLVGVVRQGLEALAAAQPVGGWGIGPAGDQLTACGRQASAIARQIATLGTTPPVVPGALGVANGRQPGRRVCAIARGGRCLSRLDMGRGLRFTPG